MQKINIWVYQSYQLVPNFRWKFCFIAWYFTRYCFTWSFIFFHITSSPSTFLFHLSLLEADEIRRAKFSLLGSCSFLPPSLSPCFLQEVGNNAKTNGSRSGFQFLLMGVTVLCFLANCVSMSSQISPWGNVNLVKPPKYVPLAWFDYSLLLGEL